MSTEAKLRDEGPLSDSATVEAMCGNIFTIDIETVNRIKEEVRQFIREYAVHAGLV